jgi:hypothetical protein
MTPNEVFEFGSISGTIFAFYFFLCLAGFIGVAAYILCHDPRMRRIGGGILNRKKALTVGFIVAVVVFLGVYFSSLDGFYRLDVQGHELRLLYLFPRRIQVVDGGDVMGFSVTPANKTLWQLKIRTRSGREFSSARSDFSRVNTARLRLLSLPAIR